MSPGLPPLVGRIAALALLLALLALVWLLGLAPLLDGYRADRETVAFASEQLPRLQRLAGEAPMLRTELDRAARDPAGRTRLLGGTSDALAGADLQTRVSRDATRHGLALRSAQILPPVAEEGFRRIGIRVALEGSLGGLGRLLYSIETAPAFLFVDNLEIRSRSGGRIVQRRNVQAQPEDRLAIRFDVYGYRREAAP
ncbi:MAG: type II secretion system protein GspM [Alphaproteobacteria bacterium]|nr:type II secretion system protein GspM [Alphaproteobacteria bacterium]